MFSNERKTIMRSTRALCSKTGSLVLTCVFLGIEKYLQNDSLVSDQDAR
jgi:hypothetical protein